MKKGSPACCGAFLFVFSSLVKKAGGVWLPAFFIITKKAFYLIKLYSIVWKWQIKAPIRIQLIIQKPEVTTTYLRPLLSKRALVATTGNAKVTPARKP